MTDVLKKKLQSSYRDISLEVEDDHPLKFPWNLYN